MVRAELGNGNRDQALQLLDRVQARYVFILLTFITVPDLPSPPDASLLQCTVVSVESCSTTLCHRGRQARLGR